MTITEKRIEDRIAMLELKVRMQGELIDLMREWETAHMERHAEREEYDNYVRSAVGDRMVGR